ncbi:MAG TPA: DUF4245 domain-containing protein [Rugosimonospora sp.]
METVDAEAVNAPAEPAARQAAGGRSARDMALSIAVLVIPIFLLLGVYRVFFAGDAPIAVDASQTYATAKHDAPFPVLEPSGQPGGWTAISATVGKVSDGWVLRVSYVPPAKTGLQLVESNRPVNSLLADELGGSAQPGNLERIGGRAWREYPSVHTGARALVVVDDGRTTIVTGTASDTDLRAFAASLQ